MTQRALHDVKPGRLVRDIRISTGSVAIRGLREGVVPESSTLSGPDTHTFVITNGLTDSREDKDVTIAVKDINDGEAMLAFEAQAGKGARNPAFLRTALSSSMRLYDVDTGLVDPEAVNVPRELLEDIGFHAIGPDMMTFHADKIAA